MSQPVVFITGASSGIGAALAEEYARRGSRLVLAARRMDRLTEQVGSFTARGAEALAVECDVTVDGSCEAAIAAAVARFGRIDVVIANAGFGVAGGFEKLTLDDYRRQFETNVYGVLRTARAALPELVKTRGRLAAIGSVAGYLGSPRTSAYCMSKFAVRAWCASVRPEFAAHGVSLTHIAPGFVASEIRSVDNRGTYHPGADDPMPAWLVVPAGTAAREIWRAVESRRRERVITFHGKVLVFIERHFPWLVAALISRWGGSRRTAQAKA
jgi:short-subunit dehydrogenase